LNKCLYVLSGDAAIDHLFRVASGLDSMVIGEPQIAGQVRCAFQSARKMGSFDRTLHQVFEQTLRVAKRVRSETGIGLHAVSVPYAAVELARKIYGDLSSLRVLLLGAGQMGTLTAEHLHKQRVKHILVANRSHDQAAAMARRFEGTAVRFDALEEHLVACDIVIVSTAAPEYVITADDVASAVKGRRSTGLFLVDLSVPRNIDPAVSTIDRAYLYNIDDLRGIAGANGRLRLKEVEQASAIITSEVAALRRRLTAGDAIPTILELQERAEEMRTRELEKCLRKLGPITVGQRQAIELLTIQLTNKILHHPLVHLRDASDEPMRRTIRKAFGLG
jgi:glutamyl-tRNA reductase